MARFGLGRAGLHVDGRLRVSVAAVRTEHIGCPFLDQCLPRCDLIRVGYKRVVGSPEAKARETTGECEEIIRECALSAAAPHQENQCPLYQINIARRTNASV